MPNRRYVSFSFWASLALIITGCEKSTRVMENLPKPVYSVAARKPYQAAPQARVATPRPTANYRAGWFNIGPVPADWYPPRKSDRWTCIVIHHSADEIGGARRYDRLHRQRGWDELGYHFVIGNGSDTPDGKVEVGSRWRKQKHGAHCKTPGNYYNEHGIGICLVGNFDHHRPSISQMAAVKKLVLFLMQEYDISPDQIYGHGELAATDCPGRLFDMNAFRRMLRSEMPIWASSR